MAQPQPRIKIINHYGPARDAMQLKYALGNNESELFDTYNDALKARGQRRSRETIRQVLVGSDK